MLARRLVAAAGRRAVASTAARRFADVVPSTRQRKSTPLMHSVVLLASGPDDKDILSIVSNEITKLHGNIEESRMTNLGGDFSLCSLVSLPMSTNPTAIVDTIRASLPDFTVEARVTSATPSSASAEPSKMLAVDIEGPDQPAIVSTFSSILLKHNVTIRDLITDTSSAPFLGYNIFAMKSVIGVPIRADMNALEADLQSFEERFGLTVGVSDPSQEQPAEDGEYDQQQQQ
jgi:glycine cleavage system transcriptional repressor